MRFEAVKTAEDSHSKRSTRLTGKNGNFSPRTRNDLTRSKCMCWSSLSRVLRSLRTLTWGLRGLRVWVLTTFIGFVECGACVCSPQALARKVRTKWNYYYSLKPTAVSVHEESEMRTVASLHQSRNCSAAKKGVASTSSEPKLTDQHGKRKRSKEDQRLRP